jgi:hypothetical protein
MHICRNVQLLNNGDRISCLREVRGVYLTEVIIRLLALIYVEKK